MERGHLRVLLGAAPGVGKTFAMLEESHRLAGEGVDVLVGPVDMHGRLDLRELLTGLDVVDDRARWVERVIDRRPDIVAIDDLARSVSWSDVERILTAEIDVISTLNIQNLESLSDVVYEITGVRERRTIPDHVIRQNADIEVVDLGEERIMERFKAGKIYPADEIDAALANFYRPGNLSALRELTLSWAADRVDETLVRYRESHGIDEPWETKERIVVAIPASPAAETIVRRSARSALRSRADLIGVHVLGIDQLDQADTSTTQARELIESLGGVYHELVGDDVVEAILAFAKAENATRVVLGGSRRSRIKDLIRPSTVTRVIDSAAGLEVQVITSRGDDGGKEGASHRDSALTGPRRVVAWLLALALLPAVTVALLSLDLEVSLENVLLVYLLIAVAVGVVGGAMPAVLAAIAGFLLANWYFTPPFRTWKIADAGHLFALFAFLVVASAVGLLVGNATRKSAEAKRARAHAEALAATTVIQTTADHPTTGLTTRIRDVFSMNAAAVLRRSDDGWEAVANVGVVELSSPDDADEVIPLTEDSVLALSGGSLTGDDRRVLRAFAAQMAQALEREKLEAEAASVTAMEETDRLRTALLNAVSHDLRTPLATIKASVTSLLETGVAWSEEQTQDFLKTILEETEHLNRVVGRLLDASRLQVGAVHVFYAPVGLDEVVSAALAGLKTRAHQVSVEIPEQLPAVRTDPALLERVVANLIENALNWSPVATPVRVTAGQVTDRVDLRIVDRGPGIRPEEREAIYQAFQRLGDAPGGSGVGLGMAVARGFLDAMGNTLTIEDTPGGGTTMVIGFTPEPRHAVVATSAMAP